MFYIAGDWAAMDHLRRVHRGRHHRLCRRLFGPNWHQQSLFGRWLDPVADKLLVAAAAGDAGGLRPRAGAASLIIVLREITVSGLREYMAEVSVGLPVSRLAKWKTAVQMTAIGFLLVGGAGPGLAAGGGDRLVGVVDRGNPHAGDRLGLSPGGPAPHAHRTARGLPAVKCGSSAPDTFSDRSPMRIRYFAWLKHRVGLRRRGAGAAARGRDLGHAPSSGWRIAIRALPRRWPPRAWCVRGQQRVRAGGTYPCAPGDEVAFFPPVTGG